MGKINQGILGAVSGKVGGIVGFSWKGIPSIRTMAASVANPNTAAQQTQRGKFSSTVLVARLLLSALIQTYWDPFARYMSGYNSFIKQNIDAFDSSGLATPASFSSARGTLTGVYSLSLVATDSTNEVVPTWVDNSGQGDALANDEAIWLWYNVTQDYWKLSIPVDVDREDLTGNPTDTVMVADDVLEFYMFFSRPDISKISDSVHIQTTVVA